MWRDDHYWNRAIHYFHDICKLKEQESVSLSRQLQVECSLIWLVFAPRQNLDSFVLEYGCVQL